MSYSRPIRRLKVGLQINPRGTEMPRSVMLASVPDKRVRVIRPIKVELYRHGESVVASVPEFEEFGQGATSSEALDDLGHTLSELFLSLQHDESRLGSALKGTLATLRTYLSTLCANQ